MAFREEEKVALPGLVANARTGAERTAVKAFAPEAEAGTGNALGVLGMCYHQGLAGLPRDEEKARDLLMRSIELTASGVRTRFLHLHYGNALKEWVLLSLGREETSQQSESGQRNNDADSARKTTLGYCYKHGECGLKKDYEQALKLYREAAALGDASAKNNLGVCYTYGECGLEKDYEQALELYREAAALGNASAKYNLGYCYEHGECGLKKDYEQALKLYREAAALGDDANAKRNFNTLLEKRGIAIKGSVLSMSNYSGPVVFPFPLAPKQVSLDASNLGDLPDDFVLPDCPETIHIIGINLSANPSLSSFQIPTSWDLSRCRRLELRGNHLVQMPCNQVGSALIMLDVSHNHLKTLADFEFPPSLQELNCSHNNLASLPQTLAAASDLQVLDFSHNLRVSSLPPGLLGLTKKTKKLRKVAAEGCPVFELLESGMQSGRPGELLQAMLATFGEGARKTHVSRAPVILCGESEHGKTSLSLQINPPPACTVEWAWGWAWGRKQANIQLRGKRLVVCEVEGKTRYEFDLGQYRLRDEGDYFSSAKAIDWSELQLNQWGDKGPKGSYYRLKLRFGQGVAAASRRRRWKEALEFQCGGRQPRTEGISVALHEWSVAAASLPSDKRTSARSLDLTLWDFAGEKDYFYAHRMFFPCEAVMVGVWNMSLGEGGADGMKSLELWLRRAHHYASRHASQAQRQLSCRLVVVGTHLDKLKDDERQEDKVRERKDKVVEMVKRLNLKGWSFDEGCIVEVSLVSQAEGAAAWKKTKKDAPWQSDLAGVETAQTAVLDAALQLSCIDRAVEDSVFLLRDVVESLRLDNMVAQEEKLRENYLKKLPQFYEEGSLDEARKDLMFQNALKQLVTWSQIIYFPQTDDCPVILHPNWLTSEVIGFMLRSPDWLAGLEGKVFYGLVGDEQLKKIWPRRDDSPPQTSQTAYSDCNPRRYSQALEKMKLSALKSLLGSYGLLFQVEIPKRDALLPFMLPKVSELPDDDKERRFTKFGHTDYPLVTRVFVIEASGGVAARGFDEEKKEEDGGVGFREGFAGLDFPADFLPRLFASIVGQLSSTENLKDCTPCTGRVWVQTKSEIQALLRVVDNTLTVSIKGDASTVKGYNAFRNLLLSVCELARKALKLFLVKSHNLTFTERLVCYDCLKKPLKGAFEWWLIDPDNCQKLACSHSKCLHRVDDSVCEMRATGQRQLINHRGNNMTLPLWIQLGESFPSDFNFQIFSGFQAISSKIDEVTKKLNRLLEVADGKDMPRLFVMEEDNVNRLNKALNHIDPLQRHFRLRICCEFSSAPHILEGHDGFKLTCERTWWRNVKPWLKILAQVLSVIGTVAAGLGGAGPCVAGVASGVSQFVERHKDTLNTLGELGGKADKYLLKTDVKEIKNCLMPEDVDGVDSQKSAKAGGLQNIPPKAREAFKQFLLDTGEFVPGERCADLVPEECPETGQTRWFCSKHSANL